MVGLPAPDLTEYSAPLFNVAVTSDVTYNTNSLAGSNTLDYYRPDSYIFTGPTWAQDAAPPAGTRPLFIYAHGGGFYGGTKNNAEAVLICREMASRGYNAFAINYSKINNGSNQVNAAVAAICDMRAAIRFAKENSVAYNVNTAKIAVSGDSAGGLMALGTALTDYEFDNGNNYAAHSGANSRPHVIAVMWPWFPMFDISIAPFTTNAAAGKADKTFICQGTADNVATYSRTYALKTMIETQSATDALSFIALANGDHSQWYTVSAPPPMNERQGFYYYGLPTMVSYLKTKLGL